MSKQLWSHPPLYGSRRQRYPRNYEGIQSITHLQSTLSLHICTCNPFSVCLCTSLNMCNSQCFPAFTACLQLPNSFCMCVCVCETVRTFMRACVQRIQRWFRVQLFDGWTVILRLYASEGHGLKGKNPDFTLQPYGVIHSAS